MDEGESAFIVQPFQFSHRTVKLTGNRPEVVASLYRIGGISPVFRHIRRHTVLVESIGRAADVFFPMMGLPFS